MKTKQDWRNTLRPDAEDMVAVNAEIARRLRQSLTYLVRDVVPLPKGIAAACHERIAALDLIAPDAALIGLNAQLRNAALAEDMAAFEMAREVFAGWDFAPAAGSEVTTPSIRSLGVGQDDHRAQIMRALFADDVGLTTRLVAPPEDLARDHAAIIARAMSIIEVATPDWAAEFSTLVSEVVLAVNASPIEGRTFAGGSVFDLYGALLINPAYRSDISHYLMTLIHESSHLRLFCHHLDDAVVLNDAAAEFRSPLRRQPRPMEGVFHAMWVSARMAAFGTDLLHSDRSEDLLAEHERDELRAATIAARAAFDDGYAVVAEHGNLTPHGRSLLQDAFESMVKEVAD